MTDSVPLTDGDEQEFLELDKIKVEEGIVYDPLSARNQEWIERNMDCPTTLYDEPVPWRFWKLCGESVKNAARACPIEDLRNKYEVCVAYYAALVKNRVNGMTPFRTQLDLHDMLCLMSPTGDADQDVLMIHRVCVYKNFNNEYLARDVG